MAGIVKSRGYACSYCDDYHDEGECLEEVKLWYVEPEHVLTDEDGMPNGYLSQDPVKIGKAYLLHNELGLDFTPIIFDPAKELPTVDYWKCGLCGQGYAEEADAAACCPPSGGSA